MHKTRIEKGAVVKLTLFGVVEVRALTRNPRLGVNEDLVLMGEILTQTLSETSILDTVTPVFILGLATAKKNIVAIHKNWDLGKVLNVWEQSKPTNTKVDDAKNWKAQRRAHQLSILLDAGIKILMISISI